MALLFMESFDHTYDAASKWDWGGLTTSTGGRTGRANTNNYCAKFLQPADNTAVIGFASEGFQMFGVSHAAYGDGNAWQVSFYPGSGGTISVYRSTNVLLATSAPGVIRAGWNYYEAKVLIHPSAGTVYLRINGNVVFNLTGLNTQGWATDATWAWVKWSFPGGSLDDVYICDGSGSVNNDVLGECRVIALLPVTDAVDPGTHADFACSTGTDHGAMVDEWDSNEDTDYVTSDTPGDMDSWNYPALGYTGDIKGVQLSIFAKKNDSGTRAIRGLARPASTDYFSPADGYLNTTYLYWMTVWELNPEDSAAWEVADVDGAEFGVKVTV